MVMWNILLIRRRGFCLRSRMAGSSDVSPSSVSTEEGIVVVGKARGQMRRIDQWSPRSDFGEGRNDAAIPAAD